MDIVSGLAARFNLDIATFIKVSVLAFIWVTYLWDEYLSYRQYLVYKRTTSVPPQLAGVMDQTSLIKSRDYSLDKNKFGFVHGIWEQLLTTAIIYFDGTYYLWTFAKHALGLVTVEYRTEIMTTLAFTFLGSIISEVISLPWTIYSNFVLEEKHGFNKYTARFFAVDKIKKFVIGQLIALPLLAAFVKIMMIGGDYFFVYLWIFLLVVSMLLLTIYPDFIAPLFDKFVPLSEGPLKTEIEALAESVEFPLTNIYVVEGSKRSSHSNAYFFGFYKNKRIVLFDTLIENYVASDTTEKKEEKEGEESTSEATSESTSDGRTSEDEPKKKENDGKGCKNSEIVAILAHELGHWKHCHMWKNLFIVEVNLLLCFSVFATLYKNTHIYAAFGFTDERPLFIGLLIIFQFIFLPYNELLSFLVICFSRQMEYQADQFAKSLRKAADLRSALVKIYKDNLSFPVYDSLYSQWKHSHPTLIQRIDALGKIE